MRWDCPNLPDNGGPPTIKNHSVTHHNGLLYCFGGYDGRRNHMTLMIYSLREKRWITVHAPGVVGGVGVLGGGVGVVVGGLDPPQQPPLSRPEQDQGGGGGGGGGFVEAQRAAAVPAGGGGNAMLAMGRGGGRGIIVGGGGGAGGRRQQLIVAGTPPPGRNGHTATLATSSSPGRRRRVATAQEGGEASMASANPNGDDDGDDFGAAAHQRDVDVDYEYDDDDDARIIIIGGWLGSGPLAASDMHVLDISGGVERLRWYQPPIRGTPPGPCNMHSADFVPHTREVYVFRGGNGREYLHDLHALDVSTYVWRRVETTGEAPQQRANHSSAVLEETNELFIFGGWNGTERLNDVYVLDTVTSTWSKPLVKGVKPQPRAGMTLTALRGRLFLFGGSGTSSKCFDDLQVLDRKEMAWLDVMQREDSPSSATNYYANEQQSDIDDYPYAARHDQLWGTMGGDNPLSTNQLRNGTGGGGFRKHVDWRSQDMDRHDALPPSLAYGNANPNDEEFVPTIFVDGKGPGRRAGHTATAVDRHIFVFGGSCGSDYLNDFFVLDTDPTPRCSVTEPTSLQLFERRLRHFYNDSEFSDVTFLVEGQRVYGHKMILSLVSDCFRAMFTTGFRESTVGCSEIEIPNCSHDAFVAMMAYIYTGQTPNVDIFGGSAGGIDKIVDLLELADQFFLDHLKQICERELRPAVNADTVEYLLQISQKTNAMQLESVCRHFERNRNSVTD